jgi:hypothetical protein
VARKKTTMSRREDPFDDKVKSFIESQVDADNICTAFVLVATIQNFVTNEEKFFTLCPPEQVTSTTIGLLESASAAEKLRIARTLLDDE